MQVKRTYPNMLWGIICLMATAILCTPTITQAADKQGERAWVIAGKGPPDSTASPRFTGDGGLANLAQLINPFDAVADPFGNVFVLDTSHQRVRKVNATGVIETIAGTGHHGFATEQGQALRAHFADPVGLALDDVGNLYVADTFNHRIRRITPEGEISTVAGTGQPGFDGDGGLATVAQLFRPAGLFWAPNGVLYFADQGNHRIRAISTDGRINTVVGNGHPGFAGDGGLAVDAQLADPSGVFVDGQGRIYVADRSNHRIRAVNRQGIIETIAGTGVPNFGGDGGLATDAQLFMPSRVVVDAQGLIYVADRGNDRIRRIDQQGQIYTVLGHDGNLKRPFGLSVSPSGELIIADTENHVIKKANRINPWISVLPDRLEILGNGQDRVTLLSQISENANGIPVRFHIVQGQGMFSVVEANSVDGLVGTQFYTRNPGTVILEASMPNSLPVSVALNVLPVRKLKVVSSQNRLVANGINEVTLVAETDQVGQDIVFEVVQGEANMQFETGRAYLRTHTPGHIVVEATAEGALPVRVDVWAVVPNVWQLPDPFEPDDAPLMLQSGQVLARSFHNDRDVDWVSCEVPAGQAMRLSANHDVRAEVFSKDGESVDTFLLSGDIFADAEPRVVRIALTGSEGAYELVATQRSTRRLQLVTQGDVWVADGQETFSVSVILNDRFDQVLVDDHSTEIQWVVTLPNGQIDVVKSIVREGVARIGLASEWSGDVQIDAFVSNLDSVSTMVHARPALMLSEASDGPTGYKDLMLSAGSGILGATGIQARLAYDSEHFHFESFMPEGIMAEATPLLVSAVDGALEINFALLGGNAIEDGGRVGRVRMREVGQAKNARDFVLLEGVYGNAEGIFAFGLGSATRRIAVGRGLEMPWAEIQAAFGASRGQARYRPAFDLDENGVIDFADFLLWLSKQ